MSHTPEQAGRFERAAVADLRRRSPRFADLWTSHEVGTHVADAKPVHHPDVGDLRLDCDVLTVPGSDVRVVVYSAVPGSETAGKLRLLDVIGTQVMTGPS